MHWEIRAWRNRWEALDAWFVSRKGAENVAGRLRADGQIVRVFGVLEEPVVKIVVRG